MRPHTDHTPKPLLQAGGKPLIVHHIERLTEAGFRELVINHAHLGERIESALGDGSRWGVSIRYSRENEALETGGGILQALPLLGPEPFLVVNGDIWSDIDLSALRLPADRLAHLVLTINPAHNPDGDFSLCDGLAGNEGQPRYTFTGVAIYRAELFRACEPGRFPLAPLLRQAMDDGLVSGQLHEGRWFDIGTPQRLADLDRMLAQTRP
jgi:MurNAc alpha-1-phosphate uridylyltransferase